MNLKNRPTQAKKISEVLASEIKEKNTSKGVDLLKITKTIAERKLKNEKEELSEK